mgnify:CR=1 FL=1
MVAREINGTWLADKEIKDPKTQAVLSTWKKGQLVASFATLQADGSTACEVQALHPAGETTGYRVTYNDPGY